MHVVFVNQFSFSNLGGVELHILNLSRELIGCGVKVTLICRDQIAKDGWRPEANDIEVVRVSGFREMFAFMRRRKEDFDICHAHMSRKPFSFYGILCARLLNIPTVFTPHCFYPGTSVINQTQKWIYDNTITHATLRMANRVVNLTLCDQAEAMIFGMERSKSRIIPNSVHFSQIVSSQSVSFKAKYGIERDYLLYVGRFSPEKCIDFLLRSHISFPNVDLVLIGQNDGELTAILRLAQELGLSDRIHLIERAAFEDVYAAYREALALILASRYEGLPTVILEARALGTPTIAPRVGGIPFIHGLDSDGSLYAWGDNDGYVKCVKRAIENRRNIDTARQSAIFEIYDWRVNGLKILTLYRELVNGPSSLSEAWVSDEP
ncbi:MAG TPA: glycosyltransferase family 4 protein [Terriglobales bacterium]|nr:glycosyltransferase family 4 protein [Terriglobales bacterium]